MSKKQPYGQPCPGCGSRTARRTFERDGSKDWRLGVARCKCCGYTIPVKLKPDKHYPGEGWLMAVVPR